MERETVNGISIKLEPVDVDADGLCTEQDMKSVKLEKGVCLKIEIEMEKSNKAEEISSEANACVKEERVEVFIKEEKLDSDSVCTDQVKDEIALGPALLHEVPVSFAPAHTASDERPLEFSETHQPSHHDAHSTLASDGRYQIYSDKSNLIDHIDSHLPEPSTSPDKNPETLGNPMHKFKCSQCNYSSTHRYCVLRHEIIHTDQRPYQCNYCDYRGKRYSDVREHQKIHSGEKACKCDQCDYQCIRKSDLRLHQRMHTGEKPYGCDRCDYRCSSKSSLRIHQTQHNGKSFKCNQCDYKCINIVYLRNHLATHSNDKRFECSQCGEKFANKQRLRHHLLTHSEKPYSCDHCNYKCNTKATLNIHLKIHTGEKAYKCDRCDYKCVRKATLQRHKVTHMDVKPFTCKHCDFASGHADALRRHLKNKHSECTSLKTVMDEVK